MDPWTEIARITGCRVPPDVKAACEGEKLVTVPAGRELFAAGPLEKQWQKPPMVWGAFEEMDADWYRRGNQLDPSWYGARRGSPVLIYEYRVDIEKPTPAVMSYVKNLGGAISPAWPRKFQYYNPAGFRVPKLGRFLGKWAP